MSRMSGIAGLEANRPPPTCTDQKVEEMAAAMKAVCDAAKADKARQEWLEAEVTRQSQRANAAELEKAALNDRVRQLEAALEEQGQKAALAWKWQQEVARLQEKLGKRSLEVLSRDQEIAVLKRDLKSTHGLLVTTQAAHAASREKYNKVADHLAKLSQNVAAARSCAGAANPTGSIMDAQDSSMFDEPADGAAGKASDASGAAERQSMQHQAVQSLAASRRSTNHTQHPPTAAAQTAAGSLAVPSSCPKAPASSASHRRSDTPSAAQGRSSPAGAAAAGLTATASSTSIYDTPDDGVCEEKDSASDAQPTLGYIGYDLSKSSSSCNGKRPSMLALLKTSHIGAAVASALSSPRSSKKGALPSPRQSGSIPARHAAALIPSSRQNSRAAAKEEAAAPTSPNSNTSSTCTQATSYRASDPCSLGSAAGSRVVRARSSCGVISCSNHYNMSGTPHLPACMSDDVEEDYYDDEDAAVASHYVAMEQEAH